MKLIFSRIVFLVFLAICLLTPRSWADTPPQRQVIEWRQVTELRLAKMKSAGDSSWVSDPGALVEKLSDRCVIYLPGPAGFSDSFGFWRLGDAVARCLQERSPLTVKELEAGINAAESKLKDNAIALDMNGRGELGEIFPEYRLDTISLTLILLPKKKVSSLLSSLSPNSPSGVALPDLSTFPSDCLVLAPKPTSAADVDSVVVLGHEALHCYIGSWHSEPEIWKTSGTRVIQDKIRAIRDDLSKKIFIQ